MTLPGSLSLNSSTTDSLVSLQSFISPDYPLTISHHLASFLFPSHNMPGNIKQSDREKHLLDRPNIEINPEETVNFLLKLFASQNLPTQGESTDSCDNQRHFNLNNVLFQHVFKIGASKLILHFTTRILTAISYFHSDLNKNGNLDGDKTLHMAYSILTNPIFISQKIQPEQYSDTFSLINTYFTFSLWTEYEIWSKEEQKINPSRPKPKALSIITPKIIPEEKFGDHATTSRLNTQERYSTASNSINNSKKNSESEFLNEIYEGCFLGDLEMDISPFDRLFTIFEQENLAYYKSSHNGRSFRREPQSYSQSPPLQPRQNIRYATSPTIYPSINPFSNNPSIEIQDPPKSSSDIIELKLFTLPNFNFNPSNSNNNNNGAINPMEIFSPIDYTNPKSPVFNLQSLLGPTPNSASDIKQEIRPKIESSSLSPMLKRSTIQEAIPQKREIRNMNLVLKTKIEPTQPGSSPLLVKSAKIRLQSEITSQKIPKVPKKVTNEEFKLWDLISVNGKIQKN